MEENMNLALVNNFRRAVHLTQSSFFVFKGQGRILSFLRRRGGRISQKEALEITEIKSSSLSEITSKLEASGYITKETDRSDRRNVVLTLTPSGWERAYYIQEESRKLGEKAFAVLTEEEKEELHRLLEKLNRYWDETL